MAVGSLDFAPRFAQPKDLARACEVYVRRLNGCSRWKPQYCRPGTLGMRNG